MNGMKGGRPTANPLNSFSIPDIKLVILTENEYYKLIKKYGNEILSAALKILEDWLTNSPTGRKIRGKNNYALFRSDGWLINEAKRICS